MSIDERVARRRYEREIAPRGLLRTYLQKRLHLWARRCIMPGLRLWLYRRMGVRIGRNVFIGLDTYLDCQFPELITIEDDVTISFRVTVVVHDDARRLDRIEPGAGDGTVAPVRLQRGCYLGAGCLILPGVTVGERAVVASGAVVNRDVEPATVVAGVPARATGRIGLRPAANESAAR
jgi:acetyltransferase-like isoleucine patch superfamily enzyme